MPLRRGIELRDLDVIIAVAEAGTLRGAAAAMALEPSAISRRVRALEERLGASIFERSRSGVKLTEAGRIFHRQASGIIQDLDQAMLSMLSAGRAGNGKVALGIVGSLSSRYLGQLIRMYRAAHPSVVLAITEGSIHNHLTAIADRSLDVAFLPGVPHPEGLETLRLWSEAIVVALAPNDRRTAQAHLSLQSLAEDQFILSCDPPGPETHDFIIRSLSNLNFRPQISRYKVGREALIQMVGLGFGISLVCGVEMRLSYPHVAFVPLDGEEVSFSAVWSPQNDNPALRRFLSLARQLSREEQTAAAS